VAPSPPEQQFWTLGPLVRHWIETPLRGPRWGADGRPVHPDRRDAAFVDAFYAVDATTKTFVFNRGGQFIRPQKYGKGPFSAALVCAEAAGPVLPVWEDDKLKTGKAWDTPWIQITAVSEDQTANVFRALLPMIQLSGSLDMEIADTGLTRINLPGGGYIEPVTASSLPSGSEDHLLGAGRDAFVASVQRWLAAGRQPAPQPGRHGRAVHRDDQRLRPGRELVAQRTFESKAPGHPDRRRRASFGQ
jgi:hypothetical protein